MAFNPQITTDPFIHSPVAKKDCTSTDTTDTRTSHSLLQCGKADQVQGKTQVEEEPCSASQSDEAKLGAEKMVVRRRR